VLRGSTLAAGAFGSDNAAVALDKLLQPVARLMIGHGVQFGVMTEMLKSALVQAAQAGYGIAERDLTDSRISILTGVHRKDVRRLREEPLQTQATEPQAPLLSVAAQVVARWISEPMYLTAHNQARSLARTPRHAKPGEPDFATLAAEVSRDVGARAVLDELLRLGIAHNVDDAHVALQNNAFVPQDGVNEAFHFLASNVSDHLATAVHNLRPDRSTDAMLEQSAFSQDLTVVEAAELQQTARLLWAQALQQFLQKATVAEQRSSKKPGPKKRVRFGVYFHEADMQALSVAAKSSKPTTRASARKKVAP
jgi:hypothetical protein